MAFPDLLQQCEQDEAQPLFAGAGPWLRHMMPHQKQEVQMLLLLILNSGESLWAYRGAASSKPTPTHTSPAAAVSGAGSPSAVSSRTLTRVW